MRTILLLTALALVSPVATAQTTLAAGDLVFSRFNSDGNDAFRFIPLVALASGTVVRFTDNAFTAASLLASSEGIVTYTTTGPVAAFTEIIVDPVAQTASVGTVTRTGSFALASSGDQLLAYQGTEASPSFVAAVSGAINNGFITSGTTSSNTTYLPPALSVGTSAVNLGIFDNYFYAGPTGGTPSPALYRSRYNDASNFTGDDTVLPVELSSFTAAADGPAALLRWTTESETDNAGFSVETLRGATWTEMAFVSGRGTTSERMSYEQRIEGLSAGTHTFRLVQRDLDGTATVAATVEVAIGLARAFEVSVSGNATASPRVSLVGRESGTAGVSVFDVRGREVARYAVDATAGARNEVTVSGLASGVYVVRVGGSPDAASARIVVLR